MATGKEENVRHSLVKVGTVTLENADESSWYISIVVYQDKIVVIDNEWKVQLHRIHDGKFLAMSDRLRQEPLDMCLVDAMTICVLHWDGLIKMLSIDSTDMSRVFKTTKSLRLKGVLDKYHAAVRFNNNLVVTGVKQDTMYWCIVSLNDGHVDTIHQICKGDGWSYVTTNDKIIYISCRAGAKSLDTGVYAFDILNPSRCKYVYKHRRLQWPTSIVINKDGNIFVCDNIIASCIHQLTASCQLVAIFTQGITWLLHPIFWDNARMYSTCFGSRDILVFQPVYQDPIIPVEILRMDNESITLYKKALQDGKEKVYNIRVMVVGPFGVGKTTLTKRLLGQQVDISERKSTDGIDVYKHCRKISLDTGEWTVQYAETEQDYRLQRLARVLTEKRSESDGFAEEEDVIPSQVKRNVDGRASVTDKNQVMNPRHGGRTPDSLASVTDKKQVKTEPKKEMLVPGSNANVTADVQVIIPSEGEINPDSNTTLTGKEKGIMNPKREMMTSDNNTNVVGNKQVIIPSQRKITPDSNAYVAVKEQVQEDPMKEMLKLLQEKTYQLKQDEGKVSSLSVWDFAGQYAFYTTHQTFLTRRAIYLLVSDVSGQVTDLVDDECFFDSEGVTKCKVNELTEVWLNSIHSCASSSEPSIPPVILVGTHVDKIAQKQPPARGKETQGTSPATKECTMSTSSIPIDASTNEQTNALSIFRSVKKSFKRKKAKGTAEASPVSSMTGDRSISSLDQPKKKRNWRFWEQIQQDRFDADTEKLWSADDYSARAEVKIDNNPNTLIALHDRTGNEPDELSFLKGDKLILIDLVEDPGWLKVLNIKGEVGLVPFFYVQRGEDEYSTAAKLEDHNNPESLIALDDYTRGEPYELSFLKGDKLILINNSWEGWLQVRNDLGEVGLVPSSLVQSYRHELCKRYFREIRSYLSNKPTRFHLVDEDFAIDNSIIDLKLDDLKRKIVEVASKQSYWGEEIPARWLPLEQELMKLKAAGIKVIPFTLLEDLNKSGAVQIATDELNLFLRFHHDIGTILYFSLDILKEQIVLDPQWMINALKSLITAEMFVLKSALAIADKWYEFKQKGKLYPELIDAVWTKEKNLDLHDNKKHILLLMEHLNIIARPRCYSEDGSEIKEENYFLAPCMLQQKTPVELICPEPNDQMESSSVLCCVFMGHFMPSPIFHRLLAACVAHWPVVTKKKEETQENQIFCGCCVFQLDQHHKLILHFRKYVIYLRVTRMGIREKTPSSKLCIEAREFITTNLLKIIGCQGQSLNFEYFIQCPEYSGDSVNSLIPVSHLKENAEVCCDFHDNIIESCKLLKFWFKDNEQSEDVNASSAVPIPPPPAGDTDRFMRLTYLLVDVGSRVLRQLLNHHTITATCTLDQYLAKNRSTINSLLKRKVLHQSQMDILFPPNGDNTNIEDYDVTLLSALFKNIVPFLTQQEKDMIKCLREDRNKLYGHAKSCKMSAIEYQTCWNNISSTLITLIQQCGDPNFQNEISQEIQQIQVSAIPTGSYLDILKTWFNTIETVKGSLETAEDAIQALTSRVEALELNKTAEESEA